MSEVECTFFIIFENLTGCKTRPIQPHSNCAHVSLHLLESLKRMLQQDPNSLFLNDHEI